MIDYNLLAPIYDFSLIEDAVQSFFVALPDGTFVAAPDESYLERETWQPPNGAIPFYTPAQAQTLKEFRPRVGILGTNFSEQGQHIIDADGNYRPSGWRSSMRFAVVTDSNYKRHRALRSAVMAIIPQLQPNPTVTNLSGVGSTGVNTFLQYHEVGLFAMQLGNTSITPQSGYYVSTLTVNLTFSVRATAWPGGTQTP